MDNENILEDGLNKAFESDNIDETIDITDDSGDVNETLESL